jgi:hypothetical protein
MTTRITPLRIIVEEPGRQMAAEATREVIKEQSGNGISASGVPFPPGYANRQLTMYDTGRMQDVDVIVSPGQIEYTAPYAARVEAQYNWAGVSPQYMTDVDRKLQTAAFLQYVKSI